MTEPTRPHPLGQDLYTLVTPELLDLLERMLAEWGSWRKVAWVSGLKLRVIRRIRRDHKNVVSMDVMDRLVTATGVGSLEEFEWFTANDLVRLGIWKPTIYVEGIKREQGDRVYFVDLAQEKAERRIALEKASKDKQAELELEQRRAARLKTLPFWHIPPFPYGRRH